MNEVMNCCGPKNKGRQTSKLGRRNSIDLINGGKRSGHKLRLSDKRLLMSANENLKDVEPDVSYSRRAGAESAGVRPKLFPLRQIQRKTLILGITLKSQDKFRAVHPFA
jgi:hypothetical protein